MRSGRRTGLGLEWASITNWMRSITYQLESRKPIDMFQSNFLRLCCVVWPVVAVLPAALRSYLRCQTVAWSQRCIAWPIVSFHSWVTVACAFSVASCAAPWVVEPACGLSAELQSLESAFFQRLEVCWLCQTQWFDSHLFHQGFPMQLVGIHVHVPSCRTKFNAKCSFWKKDDVRQCWLLMVAALPFPDSSGCCFLKKKAPHVILGMPVDFLQIKDELLQGGCLGKTV